MYILVYVVVVRKTLESDDKFCDYDELLTQPKNIVCISEIQKKKKAEYSKAKNNKFKCNYRFRKICQALLLKHTYLFIYTRNISIRIRTLLFMHSLINMIYIHIQ